MSVSGSDDENYGGNDLFQEPESPVAAGIGVHNVPQPDHLTMDLLVQGFFEKPQLGNALAVATGHANINAMTPQAVRDGAQGLLLLVGVDNFEALTGQQQTDKLTELAGILGVQLPAGFSGVPPPPAPAPAAVSHNPYNAYAVYGSGYSAGKGANYGGWGAAYGAAAPKASGVKKVGKAGGGGAAQAPLPAEFQVHVPCPMCMQEFPEDQINAHIDGCLDAKAEERAVEDAAAGPKWKCAFCTWMNTAKVDKCERCFGRKQEDLGAAAAADAAGGDDDKVDEAPEVECDHCQKKFKAKEAVVLSCMHRFGRDCLQTLVGEQVALEDLLSARCPLADAAHAESLCFKPLPVGSALRAIVPEGFMQDLLFDKLMGTWDTLKNTSCFKCVEAGSKFAGVWTDERKSRDPSFEGEEDLIANVLQLAQDSAVKQGILEFIGSFLVTQCSCCNETRCVGCGAVPHNSVEGVCELYTFLQVHFLLKALEKQFFDHTKIKFNEYVSKQGQAKKEEENKQADLANKGSARKIASPKGKSKDDSSVGGKGLAKGIGYAGNNGVDRKTKDAMIQKAALQRSKDQIFSMLLDCISGLLAGGHEVDIRVFARVHHSSLNPILGDFMRQNTMMDIAKRTVLFGALLNMCRILGNNPNLISLLRPELRNMKDDVGNHVSLLKNLKQMKVQSKLFLKSPELLLENVGADNEGIGMFSLCSDIQDVATACEIGASRYCAASSKMPVFSGALKSPSGGAAAEAKYDAAEEEKKQAAEQDLQIVEFLREESFKTVSLSGIGHHFESYHGDNSNKKRMMRVRKEISTLASNLPDGVFLRVDEDRYDLMRFMIIGPEDSPYENGVFEFDMVLPAEYPSVPPKVLFLTTGKGQFRFNPNLYAQGKVCLSLLGTWQGPGWDPDNSTILQVLVSIQAFIFCAEPFYNEPGWESMKGTHDEWQAHAYHKKIREATALYAMLWHLQTPPHGFEKVVEAHFYRSRDKIKKTLKNWETLNARENREGRSYGELYIEKPWAQTVADLTARLDKLEKPSLS